MIREAELSSRPAVMKDSEPKARPEVNVGITPRGRERTRSTEGQESAKYPCPFEDLEANEQGRL